MKLHRRTLALSYCALCALLWVAPPALAQEREGPTENLDTPGYVQPPAEIARMLRSDKNYATLEYMSPDGDHFLVPHVDELSTLELMSRTTYRLAELELRPATDRLWHLDTYGIDGFRFYSLGARRFIDVDLPEGSFASDFTWSPDGARIAFLAHLPSHTEAWVADASSGRARSLSSRRVLATIGTSANGQGSRPSSMLQWTPDGAVLTLLVPADRGAEPARDPIPLGPVTRRTRDEPTATRTFPYLLEDPHDEALFEHYTRSQIAELRDGGAVREIGQPGMYESISLSPDGQHVLAERIERPFSYITSYGGFPSATVVLGRDGTTVSELDYRPLREGSGDDDDDSGPRAFAWLPDGSGLGYLERVEREEGDDDAPRPDRLMRVAAPFDRDDAVVVAESEHPIESVSYSLDGRHAFATVSDDEDRGIAHWDLGAASPAHSMLVDFHETDDPTTLPGELLTSRTANGLSYALVSTDDRSAYLRGDGYRADFRHRPFVDRVRFADGSTERIFEGATDSFDQPLVPLDADLDRMIVSRESMTDFPDSFLWDAGAFSNLTNNVDPFPEVTAARRIDFEFERRDGLRVQGRVSLPVGYVEGQKVPAIFWTYPREYTEPELYEHATIRDRNRNAFTHMSWLRWSDLWLTQGYALVYPDIPIIGENYNDTYIGNLVDAMYGAIRAVDALGVIDIDRIGHGGHSYGAFATANIIANAPYFKAGIAGDGAYNRSLTPSGFQAERRVIWEAPHTYIEMSPFFRADQIDTPLLLYHGGDDNNTGTFPLQSRRMIHALTTLGKTAVLYEYPFESHTPRAIENKLDMWARFIGWFDEHVKGAEGATISEEGNTSATR
jgi:dipeptidyl aminopeptidase/acylaminoacyl peptidase